MRRLPGINCRLWFGMLLLACAPAASYAASAYYVSPNGNDSNAGTSSAAAWQTITKVNARIYSAGDSILFEGGQTFSGRIYLDARNTGTAEAPITVSSYGTGRATIDGALANTFYAYN